MPLWGTEDNSNSAPKFTVDMHGNSGEDQYGNTVFLVDTAEARLKGISPGWVRKIDRGNGRVYYETLIAFNSGTGDGADDTEFADIGVIITANPESVEVAAGDSATFTFTYEMVPSGTSETLQWQESTDGGNTFSDISEAGVYSGVDTDTLTISDATGLGGNQYRVVVSASGMDDTESEAATLTVT